MSEIEVHDACRPRTARAFVERVVRATLDGVGRPELAVSLLLTDDDGIARLHAEFLDDASPTDVLSFDMGDGVEVAVNVERARREARRHGHTIRAELALYIVHGILHVCGHDDRAPRKRARMRAAERRILHSIGQRIAPIE